MYQVISDETILRVDDNVWIPVEPANVDYQDFLQWVEEGNTPLPAPELPAQIEQTPAERLAAAGLTVDDLRSLLGL
jgi:hypothetical protein